MVTLERPCQVSEVKDKPTLSSQHNVNMTTMTRTTRDVPFPPSDTHRCPAGAKYAIFSMTWQLTLFTHISLASKYAEFYGVKNAHGVYSLRFGEWVH